VWRGYDAFCEEALSEVDCCQDDEDLERDITQLLEPKIREEMNGYEPFYVQHGPYEHETRTAAPAQPPQYDIAFILNSNPRVMWPLEAKVLRTDGRVAEYLEEIRLNFLTCRYSPFSSEAAMLGYLLDGAAETAFGNIAQKGGWELAPHRHFRDRDHRTSDHTRAVPRGKTYPADFRCHHLILRLRLRSAPTADEGSDGSDPIESRSDIIDL
jgi:hypothetical protein